MSGAGDVAWLREVVRALAEAEQMLVCRDRSNAALHVEAVRYSPLTELVQRARALVPPLAAGRRRLVVDLDAAAVQRLERLGAATGTGAGAEEMAVVVLEQYAAVVSDRYCFEHQRDGCGDERGSHDDTRS